MRQFLAFISFTTVSSLLITVLFTFITVIKYQHQKQLKEEKICFGLRFQSNRIRDDTQAGGAGCVVTFSSTPRKQTDTGSGQPSNG